MLKNIIISLIILISTIIQVNAASLNDAYKVKNELEYICMKFDRPCLIIYVNSITIQGYTNPDGTIILTSSLVNKLTYNELKAVGLHEIGHHILQHHKLIRDFQKKHNYVVSDAELKEFAHGYETQADYFATAYYIYFNEHNYLIDALQTVIGKDKLNRETKSHPSAEQRIKNIKEYQRRYNEKNNNSSYRR